MRGEDLLATAVVTLLILIGLFFLFREVLCWYYKINERVVLQKETNRLLKRLAEALAPHTADSGPLTLESLNEKRDRQEISQEEYLKLLKTLK